MNLALVDRIVAATLYEGYLLYPYRASSIKNRHRWTFGGLVPETWADANERAEIRVECLIAADAATIEVQARFLEQIKRPGFSTRPEVVERAIHAGPVALDELLDPSGVRSPGGKLSGIVEVAAQVVAPGIFRVTARLRNTTPVEGPAPTARDDLMRYALQSAHLVLDVDGGRFVSPLDPPEELRDLAATCRNEGVWPVLVGDPSEARTLLASPIILYDYPQIAPESPGDLFDGTEIDEILSLRILTMTDTEKAEASLDDRARALLERTESLSPEQLAGMHGAWRIGKDRV